MEIGSDCSSYAEVSASVVIGKCEQTIKAIQRQREIDDFTTIEMARIKKGNWFTELFLRRKREWETAEETKERIGHDLFIDRKRRKRYPSIYAWGDLKIAKQLLVLCKTSDKIFISSQDANAIEW